MGKLLKIVIPIIIIVITLLSYTIFFRGMVYAKTESIRILNLSKEDSADEYCVEYGISREQANDVIKNQDNYRCIVYLFDIKNNLLINKLSYVEFNGIYDSKLKQNILGFTKEGEEDIFLEPGESTRVPICVLVKVDGKNNDEIYKLARNTQFTISGDILGKKIDLKKFKL